MSRSYRTLHGKEEMFFTKDRCKGMKQIANQIFRKHTKDVYEDIAGNRAFKKYFQSYNICDWKYKVSLSRIKKTGYIWWKRPKVQDDIADLYRLIIK